MVDPPQETEEACQWAAASPRAMRLNSTGFRVPPAGQRRLWEAVKRRKAMCKRKSWMSKVGGQGEMAWGNLMGSP